MTLRTNPNSVCDHFAAIEELKPNDSVCQECVKTGDTWVHLRTCQTCGQTLCCDNSPNRHATKHAQASEHPVIASAEAADRWLYCYPHNEFAAW